MPVGRNRASDVCKRLWMGFGRLLWVLFSPLGWVSSNLGDLLVNSFGLYMLQVVSTRGLVGKSVEVASLGRISTA